MSIHTVITDIEGTTTDIHFVHKILFPYSRERMAAFVAANQDNPLVIKELNAIRHIIQDDDAGLEKLTQQLIDWIDSDVKIAPLKNLQGLIWEQGFKAHAFKGHVYEDAYLQLTAWHQRGIKLYVYSSGSVQAQKLLFGFSTFGDMTPLFSSYFDTAIGGKKEAHSYQTILETIQAIPSETLFLSDVVAELDAAKANGIQTGWLVREGMLPSQDKHPVYTTISDIFLT